jgi:hypothetical protein
LGPDKTRRQQARNSEISANCHFDLDVRDALNRDVGFGVVKCSV